MRMYINVIFIKNIIIFIYIVNNLHFFPRYIFVYCFRKVTIARHVAILTMPRDIVRSWHVTFPRYETQFSYIGAHMARYLRDLLSDEIAKYLRKLIPYVPNCTNLIMPQNRPRIYRRIRKRNYFSLPEHENELNYAAKYVAS